MHWVLKNSIASGEVEGKWFSRWEEWYEKSIEMGRSHDLGKICLEQKTWDCGRLQKRPVGHVGQM